MNSIVLACPTVEKELMQSVKQTGFTGEICFLPKYLHNDTVSSGKDRPLTADRRGAALCFRLRRQHNRVKGNKRKISNSALSGLCGFAAFHRRKLRD